MTPSFCPSGDLLADRRASYADMLAASGDLARRDLNQLDPASAQYDIIVAADVFLYIGALEAIIALAAVALRPGGTLAFSCERHAGGGPFILRPSRRCAHSPAYLTGLMEQAGMVHATIHDTILRRDLSEDIAGVLMVANAPALQRDRNGEAE